MSDKQPVAGELREKVAQYLHNKGHREYAPPCSDCYKEADDILAIIGSAPREPSGGLRAAAQEACDYYFQEHGHYEYVMGQHDENMRALRDALLTKGRKV